MSRWSARLAAAACVAGGFLFAAPAQAAPVVNADVIRAAADRLGPGTQQVQVYVRYWRGRRYCFYWDGWHGPGWYRCGWEWRRGYGWGGGPGWHGWVYPRSGFRGPRARPGRPGYRGPRHGARPGVRSGPRRGVRGGARSGPRGGARSGARGGGRVGSGSRSGVRSGTRGGRSGGRGGRSRR